MPQEKPPRRHVFWWTCSRTLSHCGFLIAYLVNGMGLEGGPDLERLAAAAGHIAGVLARRLPGRVFNAMA